LWALACEHQLKAWANPLRLRGKQQILSVPGQSTRPTASRVREAVFNIWQFEIQDCRWLDLCAGTGAMGAEALCRGAAVVVGVEHDRRACGIIRQNWQKLAQPSQQFRVLQIDALKGVESLRGQQFDRIYLDPPYASELYLPLLEAIATHSLLSPEGQLAVESKKHKRLPSQVGSMQVTQIRSYGRTEITFYQPFQNTQDAAL
jgi:16S rRNA (guanine966-N2)-methyltransferase